MREQRLSKIHFFILLSLFGFVFPLRSQEYKFRTLGVEDGLSQITVSDICQDCHFGRAELFRWQSHQSLQPLS